MSGIGHGPTCLPGVAHELIAFSRYLVGGNELSKVGALRADSGGVSDCDMGIGAGCVHLTKVLECVTMRKAKYARSCDRVDSDTETPLLLPTRQKCDLAINSGL